MFYDCRGVGDKIDLLHVNCEGCEWEMFDNLIETGVLGTIRYLLYCTNLFLLCRQYITVLFILC